MEVSCGETKSLFFNINICKITCTSIIKVASFTAIINHYERWKVAPYEGVDSRGPS